MSITSTLLEATFPDGVPERIAALVEPQATDALLEDFKLGPVFPFFGAKRPVRVAISDQGDPQRWAQAVRSGWPSPRTDDLLGLSTPGVRRMIDTDGSIQAELYLDDLQDHAPLSAAEALRQPGDDGPAMCLSATLPSGTRSLITRHEQPPFLHLLGTLAESVADLVDQGAEGIWGLRWRYGALHSVVWVTEARWRGNADQVNEIVASMGPHPGWDRCMSLLQECGRVGYPDAVELYQDGTADVTLGVLPAG